MRRMQARDRSRWRTALLRAGLSADRLSRSTWLEGPALLEQRYSAEPGWGAQPHPRRLRGASERQTLTLPSPARGRGEMSRPVFELILTAGPEHIDELGHVNNAVWVQWIQQVAVAHWQAVADPAQRDAYYWVIVRHEIDYLRAAHEGDRIAARTWVGDAPKG